jgi:hypothetical protein
MVLEPVEAIGVYGGTLKIFDNDGMGFSDQHVQSVEPL